MRRLAAEANSVATFDAVIHNAGAGPREPQRIETTDDLLLAAFADLTGTELHD